MPKDAEIVLRYATSAVMLHSDRHECEHGDVGVVRWQDVKRDHETSNYLRLAVLDWHELMRAVSAFCRSQNTQRRHDVTAVWSVGT